MSTQEICTAVADEEQRVVQPFWSDEFISTGDFVQKASTVYEVLAQRQSGLGVDMHIQQLCGSSQCTKHESKYSRTGWVKEIKF